MKRKAPKTAEELEAVYLESDAYKNVLDDIYNYKTTLQETNYADACQFKQSVGDKKAKGVSGSSVYTVSFTQQVLASTQREFWLIWGDKPGLYSKL
jgi:ATP-binding cassette, subfamily G (WHITE), member 2, SNQ2